LTWFLLLRLVVLVIGGCGLLAAIAFEVVHGVDGHFVSIHLFELSCGLTHRDHFLSTNNFFACLAKRID